jgi:hypothetical protein
MDFTHEPLNPSTDEIRLVRLNERQTAPLPPISCTIQHTSLAHAPPFKALSYARSDSPIVTKEISIDGRLFRIRATLYALLEQIQNQGAANEGEEAWYWVDELCVDHTIAAEKSHQVGLMDQIFCRASEVVIWLGPEAEKSDAAIRAIERISGSVVHGNSMLDGGGPQTVTEALKALFARAYWRCAWSVQAVLLARRIIVLCGRRRLEWQALNEFFIHPVWNEVELVLDRMFYTKMRRYSKRSMARFLAAQRVLSLVDMRYRFSRQWRPDLESLLGTFSELECDNPRDHVYALLGLIPKEDRVVVDYSKPLEEVVFDVYQELRESASYYELDLDMYTLSHLTFAMNVRQNIFHEKPLPHWRSQGSEEDAVKTLLLNARFDPNWKDEDGGTILTSAVEWGDDDIVKILLATDRVDIQGVPEAIARHSSAEIMAFLLDQRRSEIPITTVLVEAAVMNEEHAVEMLTILLKQRDLDLSITEAIVKAAATNQKSGSEAMVVLLSQLPTDFALTEATIEPFVQDFDHEAMEALVAGRDDAIVVTEAVIKAAISNRKSRSRVLEVLFDQKETDVVMTGETVETFAREFSGRVMDSALDRFGAAPLVTETVLLAAARNHDRGYEVMASLLGYEGLEITVTEAVVEAVAGNSGCGGKAMRVLLSRPGAEISVTEAVVKAAARNKRGGTKVMKALVGRQGAGVVFTGEAEALMARHFRWIRRPYH